MLRYFTFLCLLLPVLLAAQTSQSEMVASSTPQTITGQILDVSNNSPVEYATVTLLDTINNTVIDGTTTDLDGQFSIRARGKYPVIEVSFIGYKSTRISNIRFIQGKADLGQINLSADAETIAEVEVRADKSTTEFRLDKRIFNVGQDLSNTGASALEVLNNVPSVNVNIEGTITLRGSAGVQVLIDGRPSVLADEGNGLGTITADMIDKIEVVTNPSAKYEAEGTSGIINIILKKNEKKGLNGSVTVNTGTPHNHSIGVSINNRTNKFNLFSQVGAGYRELPNDVRNVNRDLVAGRTITSFGDEFRNEAFYNLILGSDYYINKNNVITLSGSFAYEVEDQPSRTAFTLTDSEDRVLSEWVRTEVTEATNPKLQYELKYKRDFEDDEDHVLLFSAIGNFFGKDQSSFFVNEETAGLSPAADQITETSFAEGKYTFNLDYTKPLNDEWTLETGAQYVLNNVNNDFAVSDEDNGEFLLNPGLTNVFDFNQNVLGVYGTTSYEADKWGIKVGLRLENTDLTTVLENTGETNNRNFNNLFPSFAASYKLTERVSFQTGYSRRIYRPRLWDLNPFFNIRNNFAIRAGNPNLMPEFTDSYELSSIFIYEQLSFNLTAYHRFTDDVIERVSTFENNVNIFRPSNIGTNRLTGLEFNFKYSLGKNITFNGDANYNIFSREGVFNDQIFDFTADRWSSKLTARVKINKKLEFESTGQHISRFQTVQGRVSANTFADLGIRYKILNGKGIINFSVRDIFVSRFQEDIIEQETFSIYRFNQRGRFITLGFSYGFGKGEAMEYSGRRR